MIEVGSKVAVSYKVSNNGRRDIAYGKVTTVNNKTCKVELQNGKYLKKVKPQTLIPVSGFINRPRSRKAFASIGANIAEVTVIKTTPKRVVFEHKGLLFSRKKESIIRY